MSRLFVWILAAVIVAGSACASSRARQEREKYLLTEMETVRFSQPLDEVWNEVRRLLVEKRYPLASEDAKAMGLSGGWAMDLLSPCKGTSEENGIRFLETGWGSYPNRYRVEASTDEQGTRIIFIQIKRDPYESTRDIRERDSELEFELTQRLAPDAATRIEASAPTDH